MDSFYMGSDGGGIKRDDEEISVARRCIGSDGDGAVAGGTRIRNDGTSRETYSREIGSIQGAYLLKTVVWWVLIAL